MKTIKSTSPGQQFSSDKSVSLRGAIAKMEFITENIVALRQCRNGKKNVETLGDLKSYYRHFRTLTDKQMSLVDCLYEKTMKGLGFESFEATYKPKKGVRY